MKKLFSLFILVLTSMVAVAQKPSDTYIIDIMGKGALPGAAAVVIKDGHWIYNGAWGKANLPANKNVDRHTVFMMASISKTMIATALMQLWEKGKFNLDDNINRYLPFSVKIPAHPADSITFRMLATHTAAIKDNWDVMLSLYQHGDSPISLDTFLKNYFVPGGTYYNTLKNFYYALPGKSYNYSNIGSTLAAYLVERISGDDYAHYCDTAIFQPLCMDHTSFKLAGFTDTTLIARPYSWNGAAYEDNGLYGYPDYPDGQLRTTITAMARFMAMYMEHGIYNGKRILQSATVDTIMKQQTSLTIAQGIFFGRYLASNGDTLWGHTGGDAGVSTSMFFSYKTKTGAIVFTNGDGGATYNMNTIMDTLYKYGITVSPTATDTFPACEYPATSIPVTGHPIADIQIYPNPAYEQLYIATPQVYETLRLALYDATGNKVLTKDIAAVERINTGILPAGLYLLNISSNGQVIRTEKILIQH